MHRLPFEDESFELVFSSHCLEHSYDINMVAKEITRILVIGGWLFSAFPINFVLSAHDRYDFGSPEGFLQLFPGLQRVWSRETPTEAAVLARRCG